MAFQVSAFTLPKAGSGPLENQDAFRPRLNGKLSSAECGEGEFHQSDFNVAIADGATEGLLSDIWARSIAASAVRTDFGSWDWSEVWASAFKRWERYQRIRRASGRSLTNLPAWLEEPALEAGAFSTLAAMCLREDGTWKAFAVGDSCIFHIRDCHLECAWPCKTTSDFSSRPYLLGSIQSTNGMLLEHARSISGTWEMGDVLVLATDAIAAWLLYSEEKGNSVWQLVRDLGTTDAPEFTALINDKRCGAEMRNDDVTLVRVTCM